MKNSVLLAVLALASLVSCHNTVPKTNPFLTGKVWNIAHQGGEHLRPSNTMVAYQNAVDLGVDMLEMDAHSTKDGVLVLSHDETLDRLTDTKGKIAEMTLKEVMTADAGYSFTSDQGKTFPFRGKNIRAAQVNHVLNTFPNTPMIIELKQVQPSIAKPLCQAIRKVKAAKRVIVGSFSDQALNEFRTTCPEVLTSMTEKELRPLVIFSKIGLSNLVEAPGQVAQVPVRSGKVEVVTPTFIKAMHKRGVAVQVWTINDETEMRRLINMGVDGIITDRPDLLNKVLEDTKS